MLLTVCLAFVFTAGKMTGRQFDEFVIMINQNLVHTEACYTQMSDAVN